MKKITQSLALASLILAVGSPHLLAAEPGSFYLGTDIGSTQFSGDGPAKGSVFIGGQQFKDSQTSYGVHAGFQFIDWFAVELGFTDFGNAIQSFKVRPDIAFIVAPNHTQLIDAKGASLMGVFSCPLGQKFSVLGVLGISSVRYESTWIGGFSEMTGSLREQHTFTDQGLVYGVAGRYELNDAFALRLDLRRTDVGDLDLDIASLGLEYAF